MNQGKKVFASLLVMGLSSLWGWTATANPTWRPVQPGKRKGISGLALIQQQTQLCQFLAVHDNKGDKDQPRLAVLGVPSQGSITYQSLAWPTQSSLPLDLEALTLVPNTQTEFLAVTSLGMVYHLQLDLENNAVKVLHTAQIPPGAQLSNIEGFALQQIEDQLIAVWAHRGQDTDPAVLFWGQYFPDQAKIKVNGSMAFQVPWPQQNVRHISDLKIAPDGLLYITAASDPGDKGPFQSAVYGMGSFPFHQAQAASQQRDKSTLTPLYRFPFNKVEAIELVPGKAGGIVLASDDEKFGSSLAGQCWAEPN